MKDFDYYSKPEYLEIWSASVWYNKYPIRKKGGQFPTMVDSGFLPTYFSDIDNPSENEIIMFELIFGEGTVKKIYERLGNKE